MPITQGQIIQNSAVELLARVIGQDGSPITAADVSTITCTIYDTTTGSSTGNVSLTTTDVVYDTLQLDARWTADQIGYNLAIGLDGNNFPTGGTVYRVECTVTPNDGSTYKLLWELNTQFVFTTTNTPITLQFQGQPAGATAGDSIGTITVAAIQHNATDVSFTDPVTLTISSGTYADKSVSVSTNAVAGIATFDGLTIGLPGTYTLSASSGALTPVISNQFTITSGDVAYLSFLTTIPDTQAGTSLPPIQIACYDQYGNPNSMDHITLSSGSTNFGSTLPTNGVATFSNIVFNSTGQYTLTATDSTADVTANSNTFSITNTNTTTYVANGSDLYPIYKALPANAVINLEPNGQYTVSQTVSIQPAQANITTNANNAVITATVSGDNVFSVKGPGFHFKGGTILCSRKTGFALYADSCVIDGTTFDNPVNLVTMTDNLGHYGTNCTVKNCTATGNIWSVGIYCDKSGCTIDSNNFTFKPLAEYSIRIDYSPVTGIPQNIAVTNNIARQSVNYNKYAFAIREGKNITVTGNTFYGSVRVGQADSDTTLAIDALATAVFANNTFSTPNPTACAMNVLNGSTVSLTGNIFDPTCNTNPSIGVDHNSSITVTNNVQQITTGQTPKLIVGISSRGAYTETGNTVVYV